MAIQALTKIRFGQITKCPIKYSKKLALAVLPSSQVRHLMTKELSFSEFGEPMKVLKMRETNLPPLTGHDVLVRMLAAPVNPSDINTIQGRYNLCQLDNILPSGGIFGNLSNIQKSIVWMDV